MQLSNFLQKVNNSIEGKSTLLLGLAGSGKTRLAKSLVSNKNNVFIINDYFDQWDYPDLEITDLDRSLNHMTIVIEDIDSIVDKRNWMTSLEKDKINRICQKITESRHTKVTLLVLGRASEIPGPIANITNSKIYCFNSGKRISYFYVENQTTFSVNVKIHNPELISALIN